MDDLRFGIDWTFALTVNFAQSLLWLITIFAYYGLFDTTFETFSECVTGYFKIAFVHSCLCQLLAVAVCGV